MKKIEIAVDGKILTPEEFADQICGSEEIESIYDYTRAGWEMIREKELPGFEPKVTDDDCDEDYNCAYDCVYGYDIETFKDDFDSVQWKVWWHDCQNENTFCTVDAMDFCDALDYVGELISSWYIELYNEFDEIHIERNRDKCIVNDDKGNQILVWLAPENADESLWEKRTIN